MPTTVNPRVKPLTPAQRDAITAQRRHEMGLDVPQQFATSSPGPGWIYDSQAVGWFNPSMPPGQSFISGVPGGQAAQASGMADYTASGTAGFGAPDVAVVPPKAGLLSTAQRTPASQNPLLSRPIRTSGQGNGQLAGRTTADQQNTASAMTPEERHREAVQRALAAMPPQVRQMMVQRALMMQGGVPGMSNSLPGQFQPPSMGSFGGGYSAQPGLPAGWGGPPTPLTQGNYIPPMQMVNPQTGQPQGQPMFGQASPFGAPQPFWYGAGGGKP